MELKEPQERNTNTKNNISMLTWGTRTTNSTTCITGLDSKDTVILRR